MTARLLWAAPVACLLMTVLVAAPAAMTPVEAMNEAVTRWGETAFIRQTKTPNSYYYLYEVGKGSSIHGAAFGSYDKAFGAAKDPELPGSPMATELSILVEPLRVEIDEEVCGGPSTPAGIGSLPFDPACRRANAVLRARAFIEELCLANVALCGESQRRNGVTFYSGRSE